jgi:hypothetical protein
MFGNIINTVQQAFKLLVQTNIPSVIPAVTQCEFPAIHPLSDPIFGGFPFESVSNDVNHLLSVTKVSYQIGNRPYFQLGVELLAALFMDNGVGAQVHSTSKICERHGIHPSKLIEYGGLGWNWPIFLWLLCYLINGMPMAEDYESIRLRTAMLEIASLVGYTEQTIDNAATSYRANPEPPVAQYDGTSRRIFDVDVEMMDFEPSGMHPSTTLLHCLELVMLLLHDALCTQRIAAKPSTVPSTVQPSGWPACAHQTQHPQYTVATAMPPTPQQHTSAASTTSIVSAQHATTAAPAFGVPAFAGSSNTARASPAFGASWMSGNTGSMASSSKTFLTASTNVSSNASPTVSASSTGKPAPAPKPAKRHYKEAVYQGPQVHMTLVHKLLKKKTIEQTKNDVEDITDKLFSGTAISAHDVKSLSGLLDSIVRHAGMKGFTVRDQHIKSWFVFLEDLVKAFQDPLNTADTSRISTFKLNLDMVYDMLDTGAIAKDQKAMADAEKFLKDF